MFFDPPFGTEWMRRMKMLGYGGSASLKDAYNAMKESDYELIARELKEAHSKIFAVVTRERPEKLPFPEVYSNSRFSVYELSVEVAQLDFVEDSSHELFAQSAEIGD
jgi:hypothetical protein